MTSLTEQMEASHVAMAAQLAAMAAGLQPQAAAPVTEEPKTLLTAEEIAALNARPQSQNPE